MKQLAASVLVLAAVSACATAPENIRPAYVPAAQYAGQDCTRIASEMSRVLIRAEELSVKQRRERQKDQVALGVALVVFAPAALFMIGSDQSGELATLKGQFQALADLGQEQQCPGLPAVAVPTSAVASPAVAVPPSRNNRNRR